MKTQVAIDFYRAFSFSEYPLEVLIKEENNNDHGNRNLSPAPNLALTTSICTGRLGSCPLPEKGFQVAVFLEQLAGFEGLPWLLAE